MRQLAEECFVEESFVRFFGVRIQTRMAAVRLSGARGGEPPGLRATLRDAVAVCFEPDRFIRAR